MRRRCTCGALDVHTWRWRRGVLTESGFHRFDGGECQLRAEATAEDVDEEEARLRYEAERQPWELEWEQLSEQSRDIWRMHVAGRAGL